MRIRVRHRRLSGRPLLLVGIAVLCAVAPAGPAGAEAAAGDPLFASQEVLDVVLEGPLRTLARDRAEDPAERGGTLTYTGAQGRTVVLDVALAPRGKSRRDREVCTFPPLWVRFRKDQVKGTLFAGQKKLKLVTYCRSPRSFQQYVIKEYLAYRIFNRLSDASFRVRLARIAYREAGSKGKPLVRYGFFIEHKRRLGKRLGLPVAKVRERIPAASLVPEQAAIAELFQFMVSNTDFSFIAPPVDDDCCHNTVLFRAGEGRYLPVPYDFDRTGLVNPPNGLPAEGLGQRTFRDRVYRGLCRDPAYLQAAVARTLAARGAIEDLVRRQVGLSDRARQGVLDYLAGYYRVVQNPAHRARALRCRPLD